MPSAQEQRWSENLMILTYLDLALEQGPAAAIRRMAEVALERMPDTTVASRVLAEVPQPPTLIPNPCFRSCAYWYRLESAD